MPLRTPFLVPGVRAQVRHHHNDALPARAARALPARRRARRRQLVALAAPRAAPSPAAEDRGRGRRGVEAVAAGLSAAWKKFI